MANPDSGSNDSATAKSPGDLLRNLAAHCHDSVHGYQHAAEDSADRYLMNEFEGLAEDRRRMADELDEALRQMGEDAPEGGTPVGRLHRLWVDLTAIVSQGDRNRIMREVLRGESALEHAYDQALRGDFSNEVRDLLRQQHRSVRRVRNRFREMLGTSDSSGAVAAQVNQVTQPIWEHPFIAVAAGIAFAMIVGGALLGHSADRRRHW